MYDLIVIGGGINGCGIARDAAMRGLKVLLVEKNDFAGATSSANSQMIHGGVRYLLSDVHTTKISCLDSGYIQKIASHLIFRIPFVFPALKEPGKSPLAKKIQLELLETFFEAYDRYAPLKNGKPHTRLSREEALSLEPELSPQTLGAVTFDEWGIDSARLTLLNAVSASEHGAEVRNHTEVLQILKEQGRVVGVRLKDLLTGRITEARGKIVFNAAGPWVPKIAQMAGVEVKLRPAKGIHIVFDRRLTNTAILATAIDGRSIFLMPHQNVTILGTTDNDYFGDPDDISITEDEIEYLLEGIETVFPSIRKARMIEAYAGIRPTLYERNKYEDDLTREHEIFDHKVRDQVSGFITIAGGKLASYRLMSEEAVDLVCKKLGLTVACSTHLETLPGSEQTVKAEDLAEKYHIPLYAAHRLIYRHGSRATEVLKLAQTHPSHRNVICECDPVLEGEIRYAIRHEWARTLEDLSRRTRFSIGPCEGSRCMMLGAQILGEELGFSPKQIFSQVHDFLQKKWEGKRPILEGTHIQQEELNQFIHFTVGGLD
jgi:glycerol-3-phosphate dehydrogenase